MVDISLNLRFLLWQDEISSLQKLEKPSQWTERLSKWSRRLADWAECDASRAEALIKGVEISQTELENIKQNKRFNEDEFMILINTNLLQVNFEFRNKSLDIWQENVLFLLTKLEHGEKTRLAELLNINSANLSKWNKRVHVPEKKYKSKIQQYFNLSNQIDLEQEPLFLSLDPISIQEQKLWLCQKIQEIPEKSLQDFFPALKRLLESP